MRITWHFDPKTEQYVPDYILDEEEISPSLPPESHPKKPPKNPHTSLDALHKVSRVLRGEEILSEAAKPVPFIWGYVAVRGSVILVGGPPGSGKSTLFFHILAGRASTIPKAVDFLGMPLQPAPRGKYLVLLEEGTEGNTARKISSALQRLNIDPGPALDRVLIVARQDVVVGKGPIWRELVNLVASGQVSDLFVDTLAYVTPVDAEANSEAAQVGLFRGLAKLIKKAPRENQQPTIWIAAHARKGAVGSIDDISGSVQRTAQCDTVLLVMRSKAKGPRSNLLSFLKLREDPPGGDEVKPVRYRIATGRPVEILGEENQKTIDPEPPEGPTLPERILATISCGSDMTMTQIRARVSMSATTAHRQLESLVKAGKLEVRGDRYGKPVTS